MEGFETSKIIPDLRDLAVHWFCPLFKIMAPSNLTFGITLRFLQGKHKLKTRFIFVLQSVRDPLRCQSCQSCQSCRYVLLSGWSQTLGNPGRLWEKSIKSVNTLTASPRFPRGQSTILYKRVHFPCDCVVLSECLRSETILTEKVTIGLYRLIGRLRPLAFGFSMLGSN
ncbi:hypothetical protein RRG08_011026 [Elysia crispata]|uniref:Uncharacterized protein n=1 Tax=Elysia crispata TaxID=231223 RepID=A0AAE0YD46_9GAST|nr:hypothetical protein RRG08_011026 [Elysia crispata]